MGRRSVRHGGGVTLSTCMRTFQNQALTLQCLPSIAFASTLFDVFLPTSIYRLIPLFVGCRARWRPSNAQVVLGCLAAYCLIMRPRAGHCSEPFLCSTPQDSFAKCLQLVRGRFRTTLSRIRMHAHTLSRC
jgi:hypothetical protein